MEINPHWFELPILAIVGFFLTRYIKQIDTSMVELGKKFEKFMEKFGEHDKEDEGRFAAHDIRLDSLEREQGYLREEQRTPAEGTPVFGRKRKG